LILKNRRRQRQQQRQQQRRCAAITGVLSGLGACAAQVAPLKFMLKEFEKGLKSLELKLWVCICNYLLDFLWFWIICGWKTFLQSLDTCH
jgi:hypothetical protein